jgi:hypothetical protein
MSGNYELHYLLSHLYIDADGYQVAAKKSKLTPEEARKLQTFAKSNPEAISGSIKRGFCNQGTYELHTKAAVVNYRECFSPSELDIIDKL